MTLLFISLPMPFIILFSLLLALIGTLVPLAIAGSAKTALVGRSVAISQAGLNGYSGVCQTMLPCLIVQPPGFKKQA